jgi:hypothetical protein
MPDRENFNRIEPLLMPSVTAMPQKPSPLCTLCQQPQHFLFSAKVLNKYDVDYFHCPHCEWVATEKATWLEEAYGDAISDMDTGILVRNIHFATHLTPFIHLLLPEGDPALDASGGYGIFARLMRDKGFNFFSSGPYCETIFTRGFEPPPDIQVSLLTLFEVLEHLENPLEHIRELLTRHGTGQLILSTCIYRDKPPAPDWWYYMFESGQHVRFHSPKSLDVLAEKLNMKRYGLGENLHLFTSSDPGPEFRTLLTPGRKRGKRLQKIQTERAGKSLTRQDMFTLKAKSQTPS